MYGYKFFFQNVKKTHIVENIDWLEFTFFKVAKDNYYTFFKKS